MKSHFARPDFYWEVVFAGRKRAGIVGAVRAVRIIGPVEVEHVLVAWALVQVEIAASAVSALARGLVAERHEEAVAVQWLFGGGHECHQAELLPVYFELEAAYSRIFLEISCGRLHLEDARPGLRNEGREDAVFHVHRKIVRASEAFLVLGQDGGLGVLGKE